MRGIDDGAARRITGRRCIVATLCVVMFACCGIGASAVGLSRVRFVVVDPRTNRPEADAQVLIMDLTGERGPIALATGTLQPAHTIDIDLQSWRSARTEVTATVIAIPEGISVTLQGQSAQPPVKEIYVKVTATRIVRPIETGGGTTVNTTQIARPGGATSGGSQNLVNSNTTTGAAADSSGQVHVRGEHAEISYVIDGVPLPDSLSGRQGVVVVPSTIKSLDIITGGFAPEFGGQTAAVLNVSTLPSVDKPHYDFSLSGGSYGTVNGQYTAVGPVGKYAGYVLSLGASRTDLAVEPQQPGDQTAHNAGSTIDMFGKFRYTPGRKDAITVTLSRSPDTTEINNRTGLSAGFAAAGEGYGFLGIRNADGTIPIQINPGGLGSAPMVLPSQEADRMDITQREINEYAVLEWKRDFDKNDSGLLSFSLLHSGQDIHNHNPTVNGLDLPVDNSIEYNPTATRNIHHVQIAGNETSHLGAHHFKAGFLLDDQNGTETYQIIPASQLALDELAALDSKLAPAGAPALTPAGAPVMDVNGNPVYLASTGMAPVVTVHRSGFYRAGFVQDSWTISKRFAVNYGLRGDWYKQSETVGQNTVDCIYLSPRINFRYDLDKLSTLLWSYDRLFNTPPIAQGAAIGLPIVPEVLDQYDISVDREFAPRQRAKLSWYYKEIKHQVDTGLLVPGSEIGLFSAVNFDFGAVHGIEFAYELEPKKDPKTKKPYGWDAFLNYSYSIAAPNGFDNTGHPAPDFNDHDQRNTVGAGGSYTWKSGYNAAITESYGSGLASSPVPPSTLRVQRAITNLAFTTGPGVFKGKGGLGLEIDNLFDDRSDINFDSGFSGTRFDIGRRFMFTVFGTF